MTRATGAGGTFFQANDPVALRQWDKRHLGIDVQDSGVAAFRWTDKAGSTKAGTTSGWTLAASEWAAGIAS